MNKDSQNASQSKSVLEAHDRRIDWTNLLFLTVSPIIGIVGTGIYVYYNGVHPLEITIFALFYLFTGLSITAGYHRCFAHRSYESHPILRFFYLVFGACALENSLLRWAADHRMHHKYVDTDLDPYNIKRGGWYAHMGWIFYKKSAEPTLENVKDLQNDRMILWQEKYYVPIAIVVGFALPCMIGLSVGRPVGGLLWGGFFRVVFVHHMTFFINSLAHMVGRQTYSDEDTSRDSWWLAFLTYGEGYHNFHHKFQADYRNGVRWYQWDPSKWLISACNFLGLTERLHRTPKEKVLTAKLAMDVLHVRKKCSHLPQELWEKMHHHLETHRVQLEQAHRRWIIAKEKYLEIKALKMTQSREAIQRLKNKIRAYERGFQKKKENWQGVIDSVILQTKNFQRVPISTL